MRYHENIKKGNDMDTRIEIRPGRKINITIYHHPTSDKTAFLIHGLGGHKEQWEYQANQLKEFYSVIVPDLYGFGQSDKPSPTTYNPYTFTELSQDLTALFNRYATTENIILGHSYGGALATALAINHQDTIKRLILISPTICMPNMSLPFIYKLPLWVSKLARPLLETIFRQQAFSSSTDQSIVDKEIVISRQNPAAILRATINGMLDVPHLDVTQLTIPTLILLGRQDKLILPTISQQYYQQIPHHQFVMLEDVAHMSIVEQPRKVNDIIMAFLAEEYQYTIKL